MKMYVLYDDYKDPGTVYAIYTVLDDARADLDASGNDCHIEEREVTIHET